MDNKKYNEEEFKAETLGEILPALRKIPIYIIGISISVWFLSRSVTDFWDFKILFSLIVFFVSVMGIGVAVGTCIGYTTRKINETNLK